MGDSDAEFQICRLTSVEAEKNWEAHCGVATRDTLFCHEVRMPSYKISLNQCYFADYGLFLCVDIILFAPGSNFESFVVR
jgi:hypothetical protein